MITLAEPILHHLGKNLGIRCFDEVHQLFENKNVVDSTHKFVLEIGRSTRFILIVSNSMSPIMVRRNVERMRMARSKLSDSTRAAIELPLIEGEYEDRSYALWHMRNSLSSNRVLFKIQKTIISPSVFRWINNVAVQTLHHGDSTQLISYIDRLLSVSRLPDYIKNSAIISRLSFLTGQITPLSVLQHGDLWIGNIMKAPTSMGFVIIDWPGATPDGLPFFDLVKFACSIGATPKQLRRRLDHYSALVGCNVAMAIPYVVAGLGRLHFELEYFPENRFIELCEQKIKALLSAS